MTPQNEGCAGTKGLPISLRAVVVALVPQTAQGEDEKERRGERGQLQHHRTVLARHNTSSCARPREAIVDARRWRRRGRSWRAQVNQMNRCRRIQGAAAGGWSEERGGPRGRSTCSLGHAGLHPARHMKPPFFKKNPSESARASENVFASTCLKHASNQS